MGLLFPIISSNKYTVFGTCSFMAGFRPREASPYIGSGSWICAESGDNRGNFSLRAFVRRSVFILSFSLSPTLVADYCIVLYNIADERLWVIDL